MKTKSSHRYFEDNKISVQVKANTELAVAEIENLNQVNHNDMIPSKDTQTTVLH